VSVVLRRVLVFASLWLLFEGTISWLATCEQPHHGTATYSSYQDHCTLFSGPVVTISRFSLIQLTHFLHTYEHELIAGFTIVLAFSTIGLWLSTAQLQRSTNSLWEAGERQIAVAAKAANAAELSARAAIGMELPIIRSVRYPWLLALDGPPTSDKDFEKGGSGVQWPVAYSRIVSIRFQNAGRTAAFPFLIELGWTASPELPDLGGAEPPYVVSAQFSPTAFIGENEGELDAPRIRKAIELTPTEIEALKTKETLLWLYIALHYRDFLGNPHTAKFLYVGGGTQFGVSLDPPAGYTGRT
jgi:hypothetical protein